MKKAFTLIELLVVIAIIAILAAILFPVFAQAKEAAKKTQDLSNIKQIGTATYLYLNDYDDTLYAHRFNCGGDAANNYTATQVCQDYLDGNGNLLSTAPDQSSITSPVNMRDYWVYLLAPYTKSFPLFKDPDQTNGFYPGSGVVVQYKKGTGAQNGQDYGGQNSYGHNDSWLSPAASTNGGSSNLPTPPSISSVPRVAGTIMIIDASYYGAGVDVLNNSGLTVTANLAAPGDGSTEEKWQAASGSQYPYYWMNQGGGVGGGVAWSNDTTVSGSIPPSSSDFLLALATNGIQSKHGGHLNVQWTDSHAKSLDWHQTVGNICLWSTDVEGAHPNCGT